MLRHNTNVYRITEKSNKDQNSRNKLTSETTKRRGQQQKYLETALRFTNVFDNDIQIRYDLDQYCGSSSKVQIICLNNFIIFSTNKGVRCTKICLNKFRTLSTNNEVKKKSALEKHKAIRKKSALKHTKKISTKTQLQISALKLYRQVNFSTKLQRANFSSYTATKLSALRHK